MGKNFKKSSAQHPKTRKQLRKEKRLLKKSKRNEYYQNKNKIGKVKSDASNDELSANVQRSKKIQSDNPPQIDSPSIADRQMKQKQKEIKDFQKLEKQMREQRKRQLVEANEKEDQIIKSLEKKLRLDKKKNKSMSKSFINEGLDYLLEVCDFDRYKDSINLERELNENVDFGDDLAVAAGKENSTAANEEPTSDGEDTDFDDEMSNASSWDDEAIDEDNEESESDTEKKIVKKSKFISEKPKSFEPKETKSKNELMKPKSKKNADDQDEVKKTKAKKVTFNESELQKTKNEKNSNASDRMKMLQAFVSKESTSRDKSDESNFVKNEKKSNASDRIKMLQAFVSKESASQDDESNSVSEDEDENSLDEFEGAKDEDRLQEDIYGRLRDKDGNVVESNRGKYIPPHLRASLQSSANENSEVIQRLRKLMKGALNRLTESNMHSITAQMEDIYSKYSRNDSNSVLLKLLKETIVSPVLSPERIVIEHALLISLLHGNVGSEIGAFILQNFVEDLHKMFDEDLCVEDKRIDNVVMFLCHLYNFKVYHACLIYEVLNKFVNKFQEKEVELILLVLKNVGFSLRKDDPASLKELILNVQKKANESTALRESARVRFMLDTLAAVKNNNVLKIQNYDPSYVEHLKKIQKSFLRPGKYISELKITLEDLLNADTKGRWWIVGSAWSGSMSNTEGKEVATHSNTAAFDQKILNLARKHRMNTDTRKNIFCILMTAEDYVDAFEKLVKLSLRGQQYQEIIHVLMHCLLKEKKYNPYYAYIAEQFCSVDRKYQLAIQFSTWDKFKEINSFTKQQITNLAKFLAFLFIELKLPLSILKVLQFTEMNKPMVKLIRQIILTILLSDDESVIVEVFSRIAKSEKLFLLREGLLLFLQHFVLKNIEKNGEASEGQLEMLSNRVELAANVMRSSASSF